MRAHDKRSQATALTERVKKHFPNLEDAYIEIQSNPERVQVVASFAKDVSELSNSDAVAQEISDIAGAELAHSVATAWQRVSDPNIIPKIAVTGAVFKNPRIHETFRAELITRIPLFDLVEADGDGLTGAIGLTKLDNNHPLLKATSVAVA
jgi:N-acetylglucosamine kinase-like BadF-type ATPase